MGARHMLGDPGVPDTKRLATQSPRRRSPQMLGDAKTIVEIGDDARIVVRPERAAYLVHLSSSVANSARWGSRRATNDHPMLRHASVEN